MYLLEAIAGSDIFSSLCRLPCLTSCQPMSGLMTLEVGIQRSVRESDKECNSMKELHSRPPESTAFQAPAQALQNARAVRETICRMWFQTPCSQLSLSEDREDHSSQRSAEQLHGTRVLDKDRRFIDPTARLQLQFRQRR